MMSTTFSRTYALALLMAAALFQSCGTETAEPSGCTSTSNEDGSVTIQCGDAAPVTLTAPEPVMGGEDEGSCTVADNGDGTKTISCEDGTSVVVSDGANGANGTNGANGANGANGTNGLDGFDSLIKVTAEPAGANCATGGQKIEVGRDVDRNGVLDANEVDAAQTAYVCTPDVDECALDIDGCEDICTNTDGGFVCSCSQGRPLAADGKSCVPDDACTQALGLPCQDFEEAYLKSSNTDSGDSFGWSVSLSGDTLAVGAYTEGSGATGVNGDQTDNNASASGAVYVFTRSNGVWSQQAYLKPSNTDAFDYFGRSVSLSSDTLAVGAYREDSGATGVNGDQTDNNASNSGAVFVRKIAP